MRSTNLLTYLLKMVDFPTPADLQQCVNLLDALVLQCADLGQLIEQNKDTMSSGYDSASKVWTGVEIVAQLELLGLTAALFTELRVNYLQCWRLA